MRKMFTKLFSLALLMYLVSAVTVAKAQINTNCLTLSVSNVVLFDDITTKCDSDLVRYKVTGYPSGTKYSFNGVDTTSFTADSTFWVK